PCSAAAAATGQTSPSHRREDLMKRIALLGVALLAWACASVPRDAGVRDVQQAVSERANQKVEWKTQASTADDPSVRELLQGELLAASQRVAQSRTNLEAARTSAELALRQHDAQNITDLDLENEQALYEQAKLEAAREEQRLLLAREALVRAMGLRDASIEW